jgi:hypothetical protein
VFGIVLAIDLASIRRLAVRRLVVVAIQPRLYTFAIFIAVSCINTETITIGFSARTRVHALPQRASLFLGTPSCTIPAVFRIFAGIDAASITTEKAIRTDTAFIGTKRRIDASVAVPMLAQKSYGTEQEPVVPEVKRNFCQSNTLAECTEISVFFTLDSEVVFTQHAVNFPIVFRPTTRNVGTQNNFRGALALQ